MSKYIHFTAEQKEQANSVDLESFLRSKGENLVKSGKDYRLQSDQRITIRGNKWFNQYENIGGYAIDFVKFFYGLSFPEAVQELLGNGNFQLYHEPISQPKKESKPFVLPPKNDTMRKAFAYLNKHRGIDPSVLNFFAKNDLIYESKEINSADKKEYNNLIFVGKNCDGKAVHAHKRGVYSYGQKFVQNIEGSNPNFSFNYRGKSDRLYVFEAPIDLLSFVSIYKNCDWKSHNYVALCGVSPQAMLSQIENNDKISRVILCLDNDSAGQKACDKFEKILAEKDIICSRIIPENKDFNEDLIQKNLSQNYTQNFNNNSYFSMEMR